MQGTTTNGHCLLPFKTGAFLAGVPVQPYVIRYTWRRVHPAWESVSALWHVALMLANLRHEVTVTEARTPLLSACLHAGCNERRSSLLQAAQMACEQRHGCTGAAGPITASVYDRLERR